MPINKLRCPICGEHFVSLDGLYEHVGEEHDDEIPNGFTPSRYVYYLRTGKRNGSCIIDHKPTDWNEVTHKYHRFCNNPKCKEAYRKQFERNMIGVHGKKTLMNDADHQRKMLANRRISGKYIWSDGDVKTYTGSYERDFLQFLDAFMNFESKDVITPSPHCFYYMYEGQRHFYIPDAYIPSLNLEVEIKDGGNNENKMPKIQAVDKVKERLKDEVMKSQDEYRYLKLVNKEYGPLFDFLNDLKNAEAAQIT